VPDAPGIAIATMCGSCAPGPQKRQLRPLYVSRYISAMNGRPRAVRGAQAWALGASACGHRHGRRQLRGSPQREPHRDVNRWLQMPIAKGLKGKGAHSAIGGGGVESSGARRSASRRTAVTVVETPGARNTSSFPPSSMNHVLSAVRYHPLCVNWATRDRESGAGVALRRLLGLGELPIAAECCFAVWKVLIIVCKKSMRSEMVRGG